MLRASGLCVRCSILATAQAQPLPQVERVVVIKADGIPERLLERYTGGPSPQLPNIAAVFGRNGVWFENFYTRGLSLSAPS